MDVTEENLKQSLTETKAVGASGSGMRYVPSLDFKCQRSHRPRYPAAIQRYCRSIFLYCSMLRSPAQRAVVSMWLLTICVVFCVSVGFKFRF
jgi:hypothetical protein